MSGKDAVPAPPKKNKTFDAFLLHNCGGKTLVAETTMRREFYAYAKSWDLRWALNLGVMNMTSHARVTYMNPWQTE